jgi:microcystin-dependent protein
MPSDPYIGEIMMWGGNYAPRGWAFCDGTILSIAQYTALYSIVGNYYGGDGRVTFALPDFRGRMPLGIDAGNYSSQDWGEKGGAETTPLDTQIITPAEEGGTTVARASGRTGVNTLPPYQCLSFVIALNGDYPHRP